MKWRCKVVYHFSTAIMCHFLVATSALAQIQVTENFDVDPNWDGLNNNYVTGEDDNDFGYQPAPANFAGGENPGEGGGQVTRFIKSYWAADVGELNSLNTVMQMSGKAVIPNARPGNFLFGWFDKDSSLMDPWNNFLGFLNDGTRMWTRAGGERWPDGPFIAVTPGAVFDFDLRYDPTANGDNGQITATISGATIDGFGNEIPFSATNVQNLQNGVKENIGSVDRFGLLAPFNGAGTTHDNTFFFDDLTYTSLVGSESAGTGILGSNFGSVVDGDNPDNWILGIPTTKAILGNSPTTPTTLVFNSTHTWESIEINNSNPYVIGGTGQIVLDVSTGAATIDVLDADSDATTTITHELQIKVELNDATDVNLAAGTTLEINNELRFNGNTLTATGDGTLLVNNAQIGGNFGISGGINSSAVVGGRGTISGDLNNRAGGVVTPGNSPGTLSITGDFTQDELSSLLIELAGDTSGLFDVLDVAGTAALAGTVEVALLNGFSPTPGDSFDILNAAAITVDDLSLQNLGGLFGWSIVTHPVGGESLRLTVVPEPVTAAMFFLGLTGIALVCRPVARHTTIVCLLLAGWLVGFGASETSLAVQILENFDTDPGWDILNPVTGGGVGDNNNFGYQTSDHTGNVDPLNTTGANEGGGKITRLVEAYYAADVVALDPSDRILQMTGQMTIPYPRPGNFLLGWFDVDTTLSGNPFDFLGLHFDGARPEFRGAGERSGFFMPGHSAPTGRPFEYLMTYDPVGDDGAPEFSAIVNGSPAQWVGRVDAALADRMAQFDRFGMLNLTTGTGHDNTVFFDDITYTSGTSAGSAVSEWTTTGVGNWVSPFNWDTNFVPMSTASKARFGSTVTGPTSVGVSHQVKLKAIEFAGSNPYAITGTGLVLLQPAAGSASIEVMDADNEVSHEIQARVELAVNTDVTVATNARLEFDNRLQLSGNTLTKMGDGEIVINSNAIESGGGMVDIHSGTLSGVGTVGGSVINNGGLVGPGTSSGVLTIDNDYTQGAGGTLAIEIGGTLPGAAYDRLIVGGMANLAGTLNVSLVNGFTPSVGATFDILDFNTLAGDFSDLPANFSWDVSTGTLTFSGGGGGGGGGFMDYDNDGMWNLGDLNLVLFNWQQSGSSLPAEWANQRPATVGLDSLNQVLFNWQQSASLAMVPEPSTVVGFGLLLLLGVGVCRRPDLLGYCNL